MTVLSQNLKTIRKNLNCTQMAISEVLDIGFRTYVRYEAGERDAPISVLIQLARLGNISLDRLLTTPLSEEELKHPDVETPPNTAKSLEVIGGGSEEGRLTFKGIREDFYVTIDKQERELLNLYRKMGALGREKCLLDVEWMLNNTKLRQRFSKPRKVTRKTEKAKNAAKLKKMAKHIKK
ncbi:MAG: hypothetical protein COV67_03815, partial [Nitrospinae bacterium CG11_big_fil_rev_8_21_14_0_20_56_8]